jgi:hypothetical protein
MRIRSPMTRTGQSTPRFVLMVIVAEVFENCPFPIGTKVRMRLLHNFHIRDGMIAKEIGYEIWRRDE